MGSHSLHHFCFGWLLVKIISGNGFEVNTRSRNHRNIFTNVAELFFSQKLSAWNSREIAWNTVNTTNAAWNSVKFREIHFYDFLTRQIRFQEQFTEFHGISRNFTEFHAVIGICQLSLLETCLSTNSQNFGSKPLLLEPLEGLWWHGPWQSCLVPFGNVFSVM